MTKQELLAYYWNKRNIQQLEEKLLELETQANRMTVHLTQEPKRKGCAKDRLDNLVTGIVTVKDEINRQLQRSYSLMAEIEKAIEKLPEREKYLVRARYLECRTWEQITADMGYSWRQIHRIHSEALKLLSQKEGTQWHTIS